HAEVHERLATLTPRERDVLHLVITGLMNKDIASALGTSERTIKVHRAHVMQKMQATSVAALVRMAAMAELCASQTAQLQPIPYASERPRTARKSASVRRGGIPALAAVEAARRQVPRPMCGMPCRALPHPARLPACAQRPISLGLKSHGIRQTPLIDLGQRTTYGSLRTAKECLCPRRSPSLPLWMTMCP